jgi:hypothetical protein
VASTSPMTKPPTTEILSMAKLSKGRPGSKDAIGDVRSLLVTGLALYEKRGGLWGKPTPKAPLGSIRNARCFVCDKPEMSVTPTGDGGVVACCNGCGARKWPMFHAAEKAGVWLSAPRSVKRKLSGQERAGLDRQAAYGKLSSRARAVVDLLKRLVKRGKPNAFAKTLEDIAVALNVATMTVRRGIAEAVAAELIMVRKRALSRGQSKSQINVYVLVGLPDDTVLLRQTVQMNTRGKDVNTRGRKPLKSLDVGILSDSTFGREALDRRKSAAEREKRRWRNGGQKTGATVTGIPAEAVVATTVRSSKTSHPGGVLQQGIHPSDHLNQASAPPTSDGSALPVERILQSAASARARPGAMPAHTYTHPHAHARETPIHRNDLFAAEMVAWFAYPPSAIASVDSADTPDTGTPEIGAPEARMPPAATPAPPTGPTAASWRDKAEITQPDNGRRRWAKS